MSCACPIAAAAWRCGRSVGRFLRPSRSMPAPTAPLETRTTRYPCLRALWICSAMWLMRASSSESSSFERTLVPIFTMSVRAFLSISWRDGCVMEC